MLNNMDNLLWHITFITLILLKVSQALDTVSDSQYIGCYRDDETNHAMTIITNDTSATTSVGGCLAFCRGHKYTYSALKGATACYCGEHFTKHSTADNCNDDCTDSDSCSGALRVYTTCPIGSYGTNCEQRCPHTCGNMTRKMCHVITGKCCDGSQDISYCNFYDMEDCGSLYGDPRQTVTSLPQNAGPWFNLFTGVSFSHHAAVKEIEYYTERKNDEEFLSIWRHIENSTYMMVAKLTLEPNNVGKQILNLDSDKWIYVQKQDVIALHYPTSNSDANMIPYAETGNRGSVPEHKLYAFSSFDASGESWSPGYKRDMPTKENKKRVAAISLKYNCIKTCPNGKYGRDCDNLCHKCRNNEHCHFVDGTCPNGCSSGYKGFNCNEECDDYYYGENCNFTCGNCKDGEICNHINGHCQECKDGYKLHTCIDPCDPGKYGSNCMHNCGRCKNNDTCDHRNGTCVNGCVIGYQGDTCNTTCNPGKYGDNCSGICGSCKNNDTCDHTNGTCVHGCETGYQGETCHKICDPGKFGDNCSQICARCKNNGTCDHKNGTCPDGCEAGYHGDICNTTCSPGFYGENCQKPCGNCLNNSICHFKNGSCDNGCEEGYKEFQCHECAVGLYGMNCSSTCGFCREEQDCNALNGTCSGGCETGYTGDLCKLNCTNGTYGMDCSSSCGNCKNQEGCHHISGKCKNGCEEGYQGETCYVDAQEVSKGANTGAVVGGIVVVILVAVITILLVIFVFRKRSETKKQVREDRSNEKHLSNAYERGPDEASKLDLSEIKVNVTHNEKCTGSGGADSGEAVKPIIPKKPQLDENIYMNTDVDNEPKSLNRIQVGSLGQYIRSQMSKEEPFSEEFELLPKDKHGCWDYSGQENLKGKNRYKNIMPYDDNRVVLSVINDDRYSDYINASFVKDYSDGTKYIASHGPNVSTMDDFWRMIWEYQVEVIVMLTNFVEQMRIKCDQYWPSNGLVNHGEIAITVEGQEVHSEYVIRHFHVKKGDQHRKITHYHFTNWPDKSVPNQSCGIQSLRKVIQAYRERETHPVVIHCSAGVGRTGTFIAIDWLLDQAKQEGVVDVLECVKTLRKQRINMVQTLIQYKFVYFTILEGTTIGITQRKTHDFQQKLSEIQTRDERGKSQIEKEFKYLEVVKPTVNREQTHVGRSPDNSKKNRDMTVIPDEASRIILQSSPTTYINAVHVKGYKDMSAFIATQIPLLGTNEDFWKLVLDYKCKGLVILEDVNDNERWFPEPSDQMQVGELMISNKATESKVPGAVLYDLLVEKGNINETEYANVDIANKVSPRIFLCTPWSANKNGASTIKAICSELQSWINLSDDKNVVVLCRNGAAKTGLFLACSNLFNMASDIQEVNVMEVVKNIRKTRPQFVSTMDEYSFLYEAVAAYLEGKQREETYANV